MAVTQAKKRAKKPPAAAKEMSREITMALTVATRKKSVKTRNPVEARRVIVPTCSSWKKYKKIINKESKNQSHINSLRITK